MNFRTKSKLVIGLTGSMYTGKSTALEAFAALGAQTISSDELVHQELQTPAVKRRLLERFKTEDRTLIARKVFSSKADRKWLEGFLHPRVTKRIKACVKKSEKKIIVVEAPVLFEAGLKDAFDLTLLVVSDERRQIRRAAAKGIPASDFLKRIKAQLKQEEKMKLADLVVANNSSRDDLIGKVKNLYQALGKIYGLIK